MLKSGDSAIVKLKPIKPFCVERFYDYPPLGEYPVLYYDNLWCRKTLGTKLNKLLKGYVIRHNGFSPALWGQEHLAYWLKNMHWNILLLSHSSVECCFAISRGAFIKGKLKLHVDIAVNAVFNDWLGQFRFFFFHNCRTPQPFLKAGSWKIKRWLLQPFIKWKMVIELLLSLGNQLMYVCWTYWTPGISLTLQSNWTGYQVATFLAITAWEWWRGSKKPHNPHIKGNLPRLRLLPLFTWGLYNVVLLQLFLPHWLLWSGGMVFPCMTASI